MNHVAFNVPEEKFLDYRAKLRPVVLLPGPDGIVLEFACWRRVMGRPGDVVHEPKTAADRGVALRR